MLVHRLDLVLARTDPFDLAQALERCVRSMPGPRIRALLLEKAERIGGYYRTEFVALLRDEAGGSRTAHSGELDSERFAAVLRDARDDDALRKALARLLKSNLRAIPLFGASFTEGVLHHVAVDRTVAIGEEPRRTGTRALIFAGAAVVLLLAGAAGEHVIATLRNQSTPQPTLTAQPPVLSIAAPTSSPHAVRSPVRLARTVPGPTAAASPSAAPTTAPSAAPTATSLPSPTPPAAASKPRRRDARATPAPAQGVATISLPDPTPTPQPTSLDVSDMPDAYTDATPLPSPTAPPTVAPNGVSLKTPQPTAKPKPHGLLKKTLKLLNNTLYHLDPFKP